MSTRACHLFTGQTPSKKKYVSLAGSGLLALRVIGTHCRAFVNLYVVSESSPHYVAAIDHMDGADQCRRLTQRQGFIH